MKKFSKMFAFILVMVLSCLFIVACSNSDDDDDENESLSVWTSIDSYYDNSVKCVDTYTLTLYSSSFTLIVSIFVRNFIEKSHANQAASCSLSHSIFCSRSISALM